LLFLVTALNAIAHCRYHRPTAAVVSRNGVSSSPARERRPVGARPLWAGLGPEIHKF